MPRVKLGDSVVKKFYIQVRTEAITADLFDQIQDALKETLQSTDKFYPSFTRNKLYIKCLMELDLLKAETVSAHSQISPSDEEDEDDMIQVEESEDAVDSVRRKNFHEGLTESVDELITCRECLKTKNQEEGLKGEALLTWEKNAWERKYRLKAEIIEVALTVDKGNTFGIYVIRATRTEENGAQKYTREWHIYRRYSDFYDFHQWIKTKWMRLSKVEFPSKQTFGKTDRAFLEKRMMALNRYMDSILAMTCEPVMYQLFQFNMNPIFYILSI